MEVKARGRAELVGKVHAWMGDLGMAEKFTQEEIEEAVDVVLRAEVGRGVKVVRWVRRNGCRVYAVVRIVMVIVMMTMHVLHPASVPLTRVAEVCW